MTISPESFAMVCYLVLMQGGAGIADKHPTYITEKSYLLSMGLDAFGALDIHNMRTVRQWCDRWGVEMPAECAEYLDESESAMRELEGKGIFL